MCTCGPGSWPRCSLAEILVLAGAATMATPTSTRISVRLKRVGEHSSPLSAEVGSACNVILIVDNDSQIRDPLFHECESWLPPAPLLTVTVTADVACVLPPPVVAPAASPQYVKRVTGHGTAEPGDSTFPCLCSLPFLFLVRCARTNILRVGGCTYAGGSL